MMPILFGKMVKIGAINAKPQLITPLREIASPEQPWLVVIKIHRPITPNSKSTVLKQLRATCLTLEKLIRK